MQDLTLEEINTEWGLLLGQFIAQNTQLKKEVIKLRTELEKYKSGLSPEAAKIAARPPGI